MYLRARWYDPAQGRFLQRDSFAGGPTRPQSLNRYAYTENNPVNWTDPSGYACVPCLALLLVGVALTLQSSTPRETITPGEANAGNLGLALMGAGAVWMVAPAVVPAAQQVSAYAVAHPAGTATMTRLTLAGGILGAASDTVMVTQALRGDPDAVGDLIVAQQLAAMDGGLPFGDVLAAGMLVSRRSSSSTLRQMDDATRFFDQIEQNPRAGRVPQEYVEDLSHVTGRTAAARNRAIQAVINEDLSGLNLSYIPRYSPFIRTGLAKRGSGTHIGKNMFSSRYDLRNTIIHEELHHRWWKKGKPLLHHSRDKYIPNERFYDVIYRYERLRGWRK